jgi:hypothetical protein
MYEIKQNRAYRVVIRDVHHSSSTNEIKNELNEKGHLVRNIINVKHRATKEPLPLFFVDLEAQNNYKGIYQLQFLQHCKIKVQPLRHKRLVVQFARCQTYGHIKTCYSKSYN